MDNIYRWLDSYYIEHIHAKLLQSCPTLCDPIACSSPGPSRLLCPWDSPGKNTGVGCHSLLQGIFPTQGLNGGLLCLPALAGGFFTTSATWERNIKITSLNGKHVKLSASCWLKYNKYFNVHYVYRVLWCASQMQPSVMKHSFS